MLFTALFLFISHPTHAQNNIPGVYYAVALKENVPAPLLFAISQAEATWPEHHKIWPWTLNVEGKPYYLKSRQAAHRKIQEYLSKGIDSIDIGPMQTNWHFHKKRYTSPWQATDPIINLKTGAKILRECYDKKHSWWICTADYHTKGNTPERKKRANEYRAKIVKLIAQQK